MAKITISNICSMTSYSWSRILSGILRPDLQILRNCVSLRISNTSIFRLNSSPSFSPEAKWLQMKQKLVWYSVMLTDIHPWNKKQASLKGFTAQYEIHLDIPFWFLPCFQDIPLFHDQHRMFSNGLYAALALSLPILWQKYQPFVCKIWGYT